MLKGKNIILGVTGSIAAYKSVELLRLLVSKGASVKVVTTPAANDFVQPLTFSVLSGNPVNTFFSSANGNWNNHVDLAQWADLLIIAPATATTISKLAMGHADNLLLGVFLSCTCPVAIAPAMDLEMYKNKSVQENLRKLGDKGITLLKPGTGFLASGLKGEGRMMEPSDIIQHVGLALNHQKPLLNKKFLVTAGPTRESIDPVRFISNHSSGKMGFEIAKDLANKGASVELVAGPVEIFLDYPGIKVTRVVTSDEMKQVCLKLFPHVQGLVMAAAVADFVPAFKEKEKIKKRPEGLELKLKKGPDILAELGSLKKSGQILVGFALETKDGEENAAIKKAKKNLDFIVLNSGNQARTGFYGDTNQISILGADNKFKKFELKGKDEVASDIVNTCFSSLFIK